MKAMLILAMVKALYNNGLRNLLIKFIDDPENIWDDQLIKALDDFCGYKEK